MKLEAVSPEQQRHLIRPSSKLVQSHPHNVILNWFNLILSTFRYQTEISFSIWSPICLPSYDSFQSKVLCIYNCMYTQLSIKFRDLVCKNTPLEHRFPQFPNIYLSRSIKSVSELNGQSLFIYVYICISYFPMHNLCPLTSSVV
jgi:hypothetical protein